MYATVILRNDAPRERHRYGKAVSSIHATGGSSQAPLLYRLSERQWRALDGLAALLGFVTTILDLRSARSPHSQAVDVLVLLACAPIIFRRRWPLPVLAVVATAIGVLMVLARSFLPLSAMLGLAGYTVAVQIPRRSSIAVLIGGEALFGVALGIAWARGGSGSLGTEGIQSFLPLAAAWFVGDSVAARRAALVDQAEQQRVTEAERASQAIREERVRIARELHDILAHSLAVMTVQAGVGRRLMAMRPEEASLALESIEVTGRTAQDELRVVLGLLREDDDDSAELTPAPVLADVEELVETVRIAGMPVELRTSGTDRPLPPAIQLSVYRIIQEALTNVVKHAQGAHATVELVVSAREVRIEVADDGDARIDRSLGATSERQARLGSQHGIIGMQERVGAFGGSLVAGKVVGHGFRVIASIPLKDDP